MAQKNNKKNRRRVAFYEISKFDYETREKLAKRQLLSEETITEKMVVKPSLRNKWTEAWISKITVIQTNS